MMLYQVHFMPSHTPPRTIPIPSKKGCKGLKAFRILSAISLALLSMSPNTCSSADSYFFHSSAIAASRMGDPPPDTEPPPARPPPPPPPPEPPDVDGSVNFSMFNLSNPARTDCSFFALSAAEPNPLPTLPTEPARSSKSSPYSSMSR